MQKLRKKFPVPIDQIAITSNLLTYILRNLEKHICIQDLPTQNIIHIFMLTCLVRF